MSKCINPRTLNKIVISTTSSHTDLQKEVEEYELPAIYGGVCECKASCIYSEKGPWSEVENLVNYREQGDSDDEF